MSSHTPRFLSRRALLKLAAATPMAAFALSPYARAEMETLAAANGITDKDKLEKFGKAVAILWGAFELGVKDKATELGKIITIGPGVIEAAFQQSGDKIFEKLACYDQNGYEVETHRCAYSCGETAAVEAAKQTGDAKVMTPKDFTDAWAMTKTSYGARKCDAESFTAARKAREAEPKATDAGARKAAKGATAAAPPTALFAFGC
jgi:hypothetical protein